MTTPPVAPPENSFWHPLMQWFTPARLIHALVPLVLIAMALTPLEAVYLDAAMWIAIGGGLLLGGAIAVAGAAWRLGTLTTISATVVIFFVCGALAAPDTALFGFLPTPITWQVMGIGLVQVWKHVLTVSPPLGGGEGVLLLPYVLAYCGAVIAATISLRTKRRYSLSLVVPLVVLVAAILFGTHTPVLAGILGVLAAVITVVWIAWRAGRLEIQRVLAMALVLGLAAIGGTAASVFAAPTSQRVVLRDYVTPPPDPENLPSPLASFRDYADELAKEDLFTVSGVRSKDTRLRLATLDSYNGLVWNVSAGSSPASGSFRRVGERIQVNVPRDAEHMNVTVDKYANVWLLGAKNTIDVNFAGSRGKQLSQSLYYNSATDTGLVTAGLKSGDSYELVAAPGPESEPKNVTKLEVEPTQLPEARNVPDAIAKLASEFSEDSNSPYGKVESIAAALHTQGFFSHGLEGEVPSLPGHGQGRLQSMLTGDQMVGDEEQYAAAMALMVRSIGYPSRVVLGVDVENTGTSTITGDDVTAWVEVPFKGVGWLPFFPTPDEDQVPQTQDPDPIDHPQPEVLQPPPPPEEAPDVPPQDRDNADVNGEGFQKVVVHPVWILVVGAIGVPLLIVLAPIVLILLIKLVRTNRRRKRGDPTARTLAGWQEVLDIFADHGVRAPLGDTRVESAKYLREQTGIDQVVVLAAGADRATFAPERPTPEDVEAYWHHAGALRAALAATKSAYQRLRARLSLQSFRKPRARKRRQ